MCARITFVRAFLHLQAKIFMGKEIICGIYRITNTVNNKCYIGKAKNIYRRFSVHKTNSRLPNPDKRSSPLLYYALNKYGIDNFTFEIVESLEVNENILKERELYWMDYYNSYEGCCGYNLRRDSSTNMIVHPKTTEKMSNNLKEQWANGVRAEHGKKLSENWKTNKGRAEAQSKLFSKTLTKYSYNIFTSDNEFIENCLHKRLKELNLDGAIQKMFKYKKDTVPFKGFIIERLLIN